MDETQQGMPLNSDVLSSTDGEVTRVRENEIRVGIVALKRFCCWSKVLLVCQIHGKKY